MQKKYFLMTGGLYANRIKHFDQEVISGDYWQIILLLTKFRLCRVCACILYC